MLDKMVKLEDELNKGYSEKVQDLINDLQAIKLKYTFESKKNVKMYKDVNILIDKIIAHI